MTDATTFTLVTQPAPGFRCGFCRRISYHPRDVAERYCGYCRLFHDDVAEARRLSTDGGTHDCAAWETAQRRCAVCGQRPA